MLLCSYSSSATIAGNPASFATCNRLGHKDLASFRLGSNGPQNCFLFLVLWYRGQLCHAAAYCSSGPGSSVQARTLVPEGCTAAHSTARCEDADMNFLVRVCKRRSGSIHIGNPEAFPSAVTWAKLPLEQGSFLPCTCVSRTYR